MSSPAPQPAPSGIDLKTETVIRLGDVPKAIPRRAGGRQVSTAAVHRWVRRGIRGVQLECLQVAGARCTSLEALQRFFDRLTVGAGRKAEKPAHPSGVTSREGLARRIAQAEEALDN